MSRWGSVDEVLDFAIEREQAASDFYKDLATKVASKPMAKVFEQFSREEIGHKKRLMSIKADHSLAPAAQKVLDLKVSDYLVDVEATPTMSNQDALILAMKREKAAFKLYTDLAASTDNKALRNTFNMLAQEEAKHKLRFEIEYDEQEMREN
ncbi:MAG: rubrerythrin [Proteobacteria bacterium]|nr:MAG: rubrerythrin [Pseudomonadota bacterium]PIE19949.1 MAG: rubrerythrin [Pseudomonadota bacterium]